MRVTAEMSLYPLAGQPLEKILAFIDTVQLDFGIADGGLWRGACSTFMGLASRICRLSVARGPSVQLPWRALASCDYENDNRAMAAATAVQPYSTEDDPVLGS